MVLINLGCEFHDQGSIPSLCKITCVIDLGQVNFTVALVISSNFNKTLLRKLDTPSDQWKLTII